MRDEQATYRRVLRRETHAARTIPAALVGAATVVVLLALLGSGAWWLADGSFREGIARWGERSAPLTQQPAALVGTGAVLVVVAFGLLALALVPGRRARRARIMERTALLVDDGVLADSIADATARRVGVDRGRVSVTVGRRSVDVRITPTSGVPVDRVGAESAVADALSGVGFTATTRVVVAANGVIA